MAKQEYQARSDATLLQVQFAECTNTEPTVLNDDEEHTFVEVGSALVSLPADSHSSNAPFHIVIRGPSCCVHEYSVAGS